MTIPWFQITRPSSQNASNAQGGVDSGTRTSSKKMTIRPVGQAVGITVPYAPREVTMSDMADKFAEVSRVGRPPLVVRESESINRMSFALFFGSVDADATVTGLIKTLESFANRDVPLRVEYSSMEEGMWHISSMSMTSVSRRPLDHEITQATVDVEFVRSTGGADGVGPVSGGVGKDKDTDSGGRVVKYEVKKDDTLHSIAIRFFKDASRWSDIAKWNDMKKKPKDELKVGRVLEIRLPKKKDKGK